MTDVELYRHISEAMRAVDIQPPDEILADGNLRRFSTNGKPTKKDGWYIAYSDFPPCAVFGDWRTGIEGKWRGEIGRALTAQEEQAQRARMEALRRDREAELERRRAEVAETIRKALPRLKQADANHPYLHRKRIKPHSAMLDGDTLIIPLRDVNGEIRSWQSILRDGTKLFKEGGRKKGCFHTIGELQGDQALCIAEGFATAASIHEATGLPVAVAFDAGNLEAVATALRAKHPDLPLILCTDDDVKTAGNPGMTKARAAAQVVSARLAVPDFGTNRPEKATDFNDMAIVCGADAVKKAIFGASETVEWQNPEPLTVKLQPEPYPVDALPEIVRAAVTEVQAFTKAPLALVSSSALGALSIGIQGYVDVKRAEGLVGPTSLFLLAVADSGERKSTCDSFFTRALRDYEKWRAEDSKPQREAHQAELAAWKAKYDGTVESIRRTTGKSESTAELEEALLKLESEKPQEPRVPRLLHGDDTPEALAWALMHKWPAAGIVSSEAGLVLGAHGMGKDVIMRHLGL